MDVLLSDAVAADVVDDEVDDSIDGAISGVSVGNNKAVVANDNFGVDFSFAFTVAVDDRFESAATNEDDEDDDATGARLGVWSTCRGLVYSFDTHALVLLLSVAALLSVLAFIVLLAAAALV